MYSQSEDIKKDLLELYEILYYASQNEATARLFSRDILKLVKYEPKDVVEALSHNGNKSISVKPKREMSAAATIINADSRPIAISQTISNIKTRDQVKTYFDQNLLLACRVDITEEERNNILKHVSIEELKYLYTIVYEMPFLRKAKKINIVYEIKKYFDDKKRTADLFK